MADTREHMHSLFMFRGVVSLSFDNVRVLPFCLIDLAARVSEGTEDTHAQRERETHTHTHTHRHTDTHTPAPLKSKPRVSEG